MTCAVEDLSDENQVLRQQAGVSATDTVDLSGIKLAKVKPVDTHDADPASGYVCVVSCRNRAIHSNLRLVQTHRSNKHKRH